MFNKAWVSNSKSIKTLFGCGLEFESQFHSDGIFDYLSQTQLSVNYLGFGIFYQVDNPWNGFGTKFCTLKFNNLYCTFWCYITVNCNL